MMQNQRQQKIIAGALTGFILLLIFVILAGAAVPNRDLVRERYDEIDWERFTPKPLPKQEAAQAEEAPAEKPPSEPTVERIDLSDLNILNEPADLNKLNENNSRRVRSKQPSQQKISLANALSGLDDGSADPLNDLSSLESVSGGKKRGKKRGGSSLSLDPGKGASSKGVPDGRIDLGGDGGLDGGDLGKRKNKGGKGVEVDLKGFESFGEDLDSFSDLYQPLIEWMKKNPAKFSRVEKRFMRHEAGNLTSRALFNAGNRQFEMLLLCVEKTYEVRIALIENNDVTLLIDEGLREKSQYLRLGTVERRPTDQSVLQFNTKATSPSDQRNKDFYRVFYSWWERVKNDI